jgi:hypothetical protein
MAAEHARAFTTIGTGKAREGISQSVFLGNNGEVLCFAGAITKEQLPEKSTWCFIEISPDELEELEEVNNELCGDELQIGAFGGGVYQAYGEQGNAIFYTEPFHIPDILEQLQAVTI